MAATQPHERAAKTTWEAIQHASGVNLIDIAKWCGLGIAAAWFWTAPRAEDNFLVPTEAPVLWLGHLVHGLGFDDGWAFRADDWLVSRPELFWLLLAVAVATSGRTFGASGALGNVTTLALLASMSIHSPLTTTAAFLSASLGLCLIAIVMDRYAENARSDSQWLSIPDLSVKYWMTGPLATVGLIVFAPALLLVGAVGQYRITRSGTPDGVVFGLTLDDLPTSPLKDVPANIALPFLANAILLAEDEQERKFALRALSRHRMRG